MINETFEEAYVSDYVEKYNLKSSQNSGLVPFEIVVKELIQYDELDYQLSNVRK